MSPAGKMYWVDDGTRRIQRANLERHRCAKPRHYRIAYAGWDYLRQYVGGKMYWTDLGTRRIQRANLDGTGVQNLVTTGLNAPFGITLGTSLTIFSAGNGAGGCEQ